MLLLSLSQEGRRIEGVKEKNKFKVDFITNVSLSPYVMSAFNYHSPSLCVYVCVCVSVCVCISMCDRIVSVIHFTSLLPQRTFHL